MAALPSSGSSALRYITISDIRCEDLSGSGHRYFVQIAAGESGNKTAVAARTKNPKWTELFTYGVPSNSKITLTVWRRRRILCNRIIGSAHIDIDSTLDSDNQQAEVSLELTRPVKPNSKVQSTLGPSVRCKVTSKARDDARNDVVSNANIEVDHMPVAPVFVQKTFGNPEGVGAMANTIHEDADAWGPVLASIKAFASLVQDISQINTYAHAAMTVFSIVPKAINNQLKTDQRLRDLVAAIERAHDFTGKVSPLEYIEAHQNYFEQMAHATFECGNFITEYVKTESFVARAIRGIVSEKAQKQLESHIQSLSSLMDQFKEDGTIHTEITVVRTLDITKATANAVDKMAVAVDEMTAKSYLDDMRYAGGARCDPHKGCLPGTRVRLLDSIKRRLHGEMAEESHGSGRILLLTGVAGSGKSAVAHEIARHFKFLDRLGASFCFSASHRTERSVDRLLSTIAQDLAEVDEGWKNALVEIIKSDKGLRTTRFLQQQLEEFILKPAQTLQFFGPVVVVIDALDEVAVEERKVLLECLSLLAADTTLPQNIRFLITSRPEQDILQALHGKAEIKYMDIDNESADTAGDIRCFIEHELTETPPGAEEDTFRKDWIPSLAEQAGNSFQWAYTACKFIKTNIPGRSVQQRFLMLKTQQYSGLESLYEVIMNQVITAGSVIKEAAFEAELREKIRRVLGLILTTYEPLPWSAWADLLGEHHEDVQAAESVLPYLASLFRGVSVADKKNKLPIQPAHTSLRDYLTHDIPNNLFLINTDAAHVKLVDACLRTMEAQLRFNICNLETSYRANKDVSDLAPRIQNNIYPALNYACRFWNSHLTAAPHKECPFDALSLFLERKLLFWLEVMSLLGLVGSASTGIKEVHKWIQTLDSDTDEQSRQQLDKMLDEVDRFILMCLPAIALSTPHLYISALAYVPQASFIHRCYSEVYTGAVHVINQEDVQWPECILRIDTRKYTWRLAVSQDKRILAMAYMDGTVALWNAMTGERVGKPLVAHEKPVRAVAFSQDSQTIASGSADGTIRLWNVTTGSQIGDDLRGHTKSIESLAFSVDGQTLVSGSDDKTVRLWKVAERELAGELLIGDADTVTSIAFSPSGKMFALGSLDNTVHVYREETRQLMYAPLEGHTSGIVSVAFSDNGCTLASGALDNTVRLWDVATGKPKGEPLHGHTKAIISVAFSPDGRIVASSARDNTIRLWMADTGQAAGNLLTGHSNMAPSISFLSDSQTLVSATEGGTIQVWRTDTAPTKRSPMAGHSSYIFAVAFSPDNDVAAWGLDDGTVLMWNVCTGEPVAGGPIRGHERLVSSVAFSPDGRMAVSGAYDDTIRLWDAQTGQPVLLSLVGHSGLIFTVAFSPDSKIVASGSEDKAIRLSSAATGEQLGDPLAAHTDSVESISFSPDGRYLASGSDDKTIMLWDTATRQRIGQPLRGHMDIVQALAFSPDVQIMASGSHDGMIRLWRVDTQEPIGAILNAHTHWVICLAFSPDGKTLVSGSYDNTIRIWDVSTRSPIGDPLKGHAGTVRSVAFLSDGRTILSGSGDHTVRLWSVPAVASASPAHPSSLETSLPLSPIVERGAAASDLQSNAITPLPITPISTLKRDSESSPDNATGPQLTQYTDSSELDEVTGYMLGPEDELLFWVPPDYRVGLWRPSNLWVAGEHSLHLDFSHFVHGEQWTRCHTARAT
ncbi:WD40 repeat-like protein [Trametopsis cervina]|nr:WD40 repeat-like protein [Trametopsis cervina]